MKTFKLPAGALSATPAWSMLLRNICLHDQFDDWLTDPVYFEDQLLNQEKLSQRMTSVWNDGSLTINGAESVQMPRASGKAFPGMALPLTARLCAYRVIAELAPMLTPKLLRDKVYGFEFHAADLPLFSPPGDGLGELFENAASNALLGSSDSLYVQDVDEFLNTAKAQTLEKLLMQNGARPDQARFLRELIGGSGSLVSVDDAFAFVYNYYLQPSDDSLIKAQTNFFRYRDEYFVMEPADQKRIADAIAELGLTCRVIAEFRRLYRKAEMSDKVTPQKSEAEEVIGEFAGGKLVAQYECQTWDKDKKICQTDHYEVRYYAVGANSFREMTKLNPRPNLQDALQILPLLRVIHERRKTGVLLVPPFDGATREFKQYQAEIHNSMDWIEQALRTAIEQRSLWQISWAALLAGDSGRLRRSAVDLLREVARDDRFNRLAQSRACLALARSSEEHPDTFWSSPAADSSEHLFRESLLAARNLAGRGHPQAWEQSKTEGNKREPELMKYLESNIPAN